MFRTKLSRIVFLVAFIAQVIYVHFGPEGEDFTQLSNHLLENPLKIPLYIVFMLLPAFIASFAIPWIASWVMRGE